MPLIYPRLETAEHIAQTVTTGKRAVTGAYNVLGKVTSSVAGVVGAKEFVGSGFDSVKRAVGKSGLMGGILSPFGEFDLMDELRDQWTHESKVSEPSTTYPLLSNLADIFFSAAGPGKNISNPHTPRNIPPKIPANDIPLRRRLSLRRRSSPRSFKPIRPQNNVSTHRLTRRKHTTTIIRHQITPRKRQTAIRPREWSPLK